MVIRLVALKTLTGAAGVPAIYVNDNFGRVAPAGYFDVDRQESNT